MSQTLLQKGVKLVRDEATVSVGQSSVKSGSAELLQHKLHLSALAASYHTFAAFIIQFSATQILSAIHQYMRCINEVN